MCYFICCEIILGYIERNKTITSDQTAFKKKIKKLCHTRDENVRLINLSAVDWLVPSQLFSILLCTKTFPYSLHCIHSFNWFMSYNAHSVYTAYTDNPFLMMGMSAMPAKMKKTMMVRIRRNIRPGLPWNVTVNFWITSAKEWKFLDMTKTIDSKCWSLECRDLKRCLKWKEVEGGQSINKDHGRKTRGKKERAPSVA